jgi:hypothetical protein
MQSRACLSNALQARSVTRLVLLLKLQTPQPDDALVITPYDEKNAA